MIGHHAGGEWGLPAAQLDKSVTARVPTRTDDDDRYTRVTEYKHLTGQSHRCTSLTYEYPTDVGDPYYPVPRAQNQQQYKLYENLTRTTPDTEFVGRLATYRYYNMDQIVGQALAAYRRLAESVGHRVDHTLGSNPEACIPAVGLTGT